jgi:hypothetical protein
MVAEQRLRARIDELKEYRRNGEHAPLPRLPPLPHAELSGEVGTRGATLCTNALCYVHTGVHTLPEAEAFDAEKRRRDAERARLRSLGGSGFLGSQGPPPTYPCA